MSQKGITGNNDDDDDDGQSTDDNIIWCMYLACCIPKATDTHAQNKQYFFLLHRNNGYANAPKFFDYLYNVCLVL